MESGVEWCWWRSGVDTAMTELKCELCIIGAGYAGLNALNAAVKYLPKGACVVVVDRGVRWGGQWPDTYGFVRLHQPHRMFTAGERPWSIDKPKHHLATKGEILNHFDDIVSACTSEREIELLELFCYQYDGHHTVCNGRVHLTAQPLMGGTGGHPATDENSGARAPAIAIDAARLINASGFDVAKKLPLTLTASIERSVNRSTRGFVHSLAPADMLSPHWTALLRYSEDADKPIWVLGSGKTAMDAINHLSKHATTKGRLHCLAGRGSWFLNRDCMFPMDWWELHRPGLRTSTDHFIDMMELYDGNNEAEVYAAACRAGAMHSPIDAPTSFSFGMCSTAEVANVRAVLAPKEERVLKAHLVDVRPHSTDDALAVMELRKTDGSDECFFREIPAGSFIVNCTDNIAPIDKVLPIVDDSGLVCAPQALCCFSGPSADHVVHAWFLGTLRSMWKIMPRISVSVQNKHKLGLHMLFLLVLSNAMVMSRLPKAIVNGNKQNPNRYPLYRVMPTGMRLKRLFPSLLSKMQKIMPMRYTDTAITETEREAHASVGVLGGNAGIAAILPPSARL